MATAKKLPSGNWRVRAYVGKDKNGKPVYKSFTAKTKKEAERLASVYEYQDEQNEEHDITVDEAISKYINSVSSILSPASIRKYESMRKNNFGRIKDQHLKDLSLEEYQDFVNEISMSLSPKSVSSVCGLLTATLKFHDPSFSLALKRPSLRKETMVIPTDQQVKELIAGAGSPGMECAFALGALLGMRRSEISPLTWEDIDGSVIHINKAMVQDKNNQWVIKSTKTTAGTRSLEMPEYLQKKILALKTPEAEPSDRIFQFTPSAITMRFMKVCKSIGFHCRFHDLRHYNASVMLALGVPDKYAMQRMGHATPHMLKNVYQHIMDEKEKEVNNSMNEYMENVVRE